MTKSIRSTIEDRIEAGLDAAEAKVQLAMTAPESEVRKMAKRTSAAIESLKISLADLDNATPRPEPDPRQERLPGTDPEEPTDEDL